MAHRKGPKKFNQAFIFTPKKEDIQVKPTLPDVSTNKTCVSVVKNDSVYNATNVCKVSNQTNWWTTYLLKQSTMPILIQVRLS